MSSPVLQRDLSAYQSAVDRYNRQLNTYNRGVSQYNQTLVTDQSGNILVRDSAGNVYAVDSAGKLSGTELANGKSVADYGATAIEGDNRFQLLRQGPTQPSTETVSGALATYNDNGQITGYYMPNSEGGGQPLGVGWKVVSQQGPSSEGGSTTYTLARDTSTYMNKPADFTGQVSMAKPDPSLAQARRMFVPGAAEQERGLIGDVIRGHGVTGGTPVQYRSGATLPGAGQAVQTRNPSVDPGAVPQAPAPAPTPAPAPNFSVPAGNTTPSYPTSTPGTPQFQQDLTNYLGNSYVADSQKAVQDSLSTLSNQISSGYYGTPSVPAYTPPPAVNFPSYDPYSSGGLFGAGSGFYIGF